MRFYIYAVFLALAFSGCKKQIEEKKEDLLVNLIVSGQWVVAKYTKGPADVTDDFSPYSFQFKRDFTVDAINATTNNAVENTGTWNGDIVTKTIVSNIPKPNPILILLIGTWLV
jgi:hypothetical protein